MKHFVLNIIVALGLLVPVFAGDQLLLYKISNPDREIINQLERMGAVTSFYLPGEDAEVYLTAKHLAFLESRRYKVTKLDPNFLAKLALDSLSDDHIIGNTYHTYEAVSFILDSLQSAYPDISRLISLGQTVEGRELWAINISDNPGVEEPEPEVRYAAAIHGNETVTQEVMLHFIAHLLQSYAFDARIKNLIDETEIWIIPNMNFDGTAVQSRFNFNYVDLNRNFPDREPGFVNPDSIQPETGAMIGWSKTHHFVSAANFHSGALVVNYPWDKHIDGQQGYAATPDDPVFRRLALSYASENIAMYASAIFENGITNGAAWYETSGSMQDWNYHFNSCLELTIEISQIKTPEASQITSLWLDNRESMLTLLEQVHSGVRGIMTDTQTGLPLAAQISVTGIDKTVESDPDAGDYYRLLEPGVYQLTFSSTGYQPQTFRNVHVQSGAASVLDVQLDPIVYFSLTGTVQDNESGAWIADALIEFTGQNNFTDSIRTGSNGQFSAILPEGEYEVTVVHPGYFTHKSVISFFSDRSVNYFLDRMLPGKIKGIVRLMEAGSVTGAVIYVQGKTDTVRSDGVFEIDGIIPGQVNVFAHKFGFITAQTDTLLQNGDSLSLELELWSGSNEFFSDFEDGVPLFNGTGDWEFGVFNSGESAKNTGNYIWCTILGDDYSAGIHQDYLETPFYSIQGFVIPQLEFFHLYDIEENYDGGNVKVSADEGKSWQVIHPVPDYPVQSISNEYGNPMAGEPAYSGRTIGWEQAKFDLSAYINQPFLKFRFDFGADEQKEAPGWSIDRFRVFDANATALPGDRTRPLPDALDLDIYPNPANPTATITFQTQQKSVITLQIVSITGQLVKEVKFGALSEKKYQWHWDGVNTRGQKAASGLYFVRLISANQFRIKKFILIR